MEAVDIANIFREHFQTEQRGLMQKEMPHATCPLLDKPVRVTSKDVSRVLHNMCRGKSPGHDGLCVEHLKHPHALDAPRLVHRVCSPHLCRVMAMFYSFCLSHAFVLDGVLNGYLSHCVVLEDSYKDNLG